jgi:hypothetical protein
MLTMIPKCMAKEADLIFELLTGCSDWDTTEMIAFRNQIRRSASNLMLCKGSSCVRMQRLKFNWCHIKCYMRCRIGCSDIDKKNKLQITSVNCETNLLSLINPLLAHTYCSTIVSNHGLIGLKNSSRKLVAIYTISYFLIYI